MSAYAIPISRLKAESELGASWNTAQSVPAWFRKPMALLIVPNAFRFINQTVTNERLGSLQASEAAELYPSFSELYDAGTSLLEWANSRSSLERILLKSFINKLSAEMEKLEDIVEALAWGSDDSLRSLVSTAIAEIEAAG